MLTQIADTGHLEIYRDKAPYIFLHAVFACSPSGAAAVPSSCPHSHVAEIAILHPQLSHADKG